MSGQPPDDGDPVHVANLWGYPVRLVEIDADSERTTHDFDDTEPRDPFV